MCPIGVYSVCPRRSRSSAPPPRQCSPRRAPPTEGYRPRAICRVTFQLLLHPQRRIQCSLRMVLVCDWRAEQREDAVAGRLHDIAVVTSHRVDHQLERRIDYRARFFGVEVLLELGRSLDVGEQRGDRLALALEFFSVGRLSYPDFCCFGSRWLGRCACSERSTASAAEFGRGYVFKAARSTGRFECGTAFVAELQAVGIFGFAVRAKHGHVRESRRYGCVSRCADGVQSAWSGPLTIGNTVRYFRARARRVDNPISCSITVSRPSGGRFAA